MKKVITENSWFDSNLSAEPESDLEVILLANNIEENQKIKYIETCLFVEPNSINKKNSFSTFPLIFAIAAGNLNIVKFLVSKGANIHLKDKFGLTPLFYASGQFQNLEITEYLLKQGAKVNEQNNFENTPLHGAALVGNVLICQLLLKYGADPNIEGEDGKPLDVTSNEKVKAVIIEFCCKTEIKREIKTQQTCTFCLKKKENLKKCSSCHSAFYCDRECQTKDWKKHKLNCICAVVYLNSDDKLNTKYMTNISLNHQKSSVKVGNFMKSEEMIKFKDLNKPIIVKIQANEVEREPLMCYNQDRSLNFFISSTNGDYKMIKEKIQRDGLYKEYSKSGVGLKAYFWAESDGDKMKVFTEKICSSQSW
jgi:hypothetical protein